MTLVQRDRVIEIVLPPDEYWWGGKIVSGSAMPFGEGTSIDLHDLGGNSGMPLLISNQGRYLWSNAPFSFELSAGKLRAQGSPTGAEIEVHSGCGSTLRETQLSAARDHFQLGEKTPGDLMFTAPQYNTWIEMTYFSTQERVLDYADAVLANGFPPGVLMLDTLWHPTYSDWNFDRGRFPDPAGMVARLHELGFKVMLWVCPYVTADTLTFRQLREAGLLFRQPDGKPAIAEWWDGFSAVLDVTNPNALDWLYAQLGRLVNEIGIDGFKFDGGQPELYAGIGAPDPHSCTTAWNRTGLRYSFSEYKDSWLAAGLPLAQRIRDRHHTWDDQHGLGSLIPFGLAQGLIGYPFNCPDMVGGGEYKDFPAGGGGSFDPELMVRSAQVSALFPMMQFSAAPWRLLDKEHLQYCLAATRLHAQLGPEILALARHAAQTGEPVMRSMEYVFPGMGYPSIRDQFLLSDDILVAPVIEKGSVSRQIMFPPGVWAGDDGRTHNGPSRQEVPAPLSHLPWFRRVS